MYPLMNKVIWLKKSEDGKNLNSADQADDDFWCDIWDFQSNCANGLRIHMTRKHQQLEELDGNVSVFDDLDNDDK